MQARRRQLCQAGLAMGALVAGPACRVAPPLRVLVSPRDGLGALVFWVALGARLFDEPDIAVEMVVADDVSAKIRGLLGDRADLAIAPPQVPAELIARGFPFRWIATLMARAPACLVGHYDRVAEPLPAGLSARLDRLKGLILGVALEDEPRLEALFEEGGRDLRRVVRVKRMTPEHHNAALASKTVDALFTRSPHLEKSLLYSRAVLLVAPPRGEVKALDGLSTQALLAHPGAYAERGRSLAAFVAGLQRAADLCRTSPDAAVEALLEVLPNRNPTELGPAVELYTAALPPTLHPSPTAILRTAPLFPAAAPDPTWNEVAARTDPRFAIAAATSTPPYERLRWPGLMAAGAGLMGWAMARRGAK